MLEFDGKTWAKEIEHMQAVKRSGNVHTYEEENIAYFIQSGGNDYLHLYSKLGALYGCMAKHYYVEDIRNENVAEYMYLSGLAMVLVKKMYD